MNPGGRTGIHSVPSPPPLAMSRRRSPTARVALAQGLYYAATGVWPFLSMRTFLAVTGPKVDLWLVKTVGGLVGVVGGALLAAGARGRVPEELQGLAVGSAAFLAGVDAVYAAKGRIPPVYLLDAVAEAGLIGAWAWARRREGQALARW